MRRPRYSEAIDWICENEYDCSAGTHDVVVMLVAYLFGVEAVLVLRAVENRRK